MSDGVDEDAGASLSNSSTENSNNVSDDGDEISPKKAWLEAKKDIEDAETPSEETDAAVEFLDVVAEADETNDEFYESEAWISTVAENTGLTKTKVRDIYEERIEQVKDQQDGVAPRIDTHIKQNLEELTIYKPQDSNAETTYQWTLSRYSGDGTVTIETEGHHRDPHTLKNMYFDAATESLRPPAETVEADWTGFIEQVIINNGTVERPVGPRTEAIHDLRQHIQTKTAYDDQFVAYKRGGRGALYMESEDAEEIWVENSRVTKICEEHGIEPRALTSELKAKNLRAGSVKEVTYRDGSYARWWRLNRDIADPQEIKTDCDPESLTTEFNADEFEEVA